jgi:hypothetical protein
MMEEEDLSDWVEVVDRIEKRVQEIFCPSEEDPQIKI